MITIVGPKDFPPNGVPKVHNNTMVINTTSRGNCGWSLSPFFLGPVRLYCGFTSQNVENAWQFSKVYPRHIDRDGYLKDSYFDWAVSGWRDKKAHRYPMGKGAKPLHSYWDGELYDYIEARKKIYIPLYARAVVKEPLYTMLNSYTDDLILWDFDGYDHKKLNMSYDDVVNNPKRKMGHAFVLGMLLENHPLPFL